MGGLPVIALLLAAGPGRVLVLTASPGPSTEPLQSAIEHRLEAQQIPLLRSTDAGASIGIADPPVEDLATREAVAGLIADTGKAYYDDRYEQMLDRLSKTEALKTSPEERIAIALWRVAVYLALNDAHGASDQARVALTLDPALKVDLKTFPPGVHDVVERVRPTLTMLPVKITGLPAASTILVDDRPASASFTAPAGSHLITIAVPGCRRLDLPLELATPGATLDARPPVALDAAKTRTVSDDSWTGGADSGLLDALAAKTGADVIVTGTSRDGQARVVVWWAADGRRLVSSLHGDDATGLSGLAEFAAREIQRGRPGLRDQVLRLSATGALVGAFRITAVDGKTGKYRTVVDGSGPQLTIGAARGAWSAALVGEAVDYGFSNVTVSGATDARATGGQSLAGRLEIGWDAHLGQPGEAAGALVGVRLRLGATSYHGYDPGGVGLVPSETRAFTEIGAWASFVAPFARLSEMRILAGIAICPYEVETVQGDLWGRSSAALGYTGDTGLSWRTRRRWQIGVMVHNDDHQLLFKGRSGVPASPAFHDVNVEEQTGSLWLTAGREF